MKDALAVVALQKAQYALQFKMHCRLKIALHLLVESTGFILWNILSVTADKALALSKKP